jgi:hypothetical protein
MINSPQPSNTTHYRFNSHYTPIIGVSLLAMVLFSISLFFTSPTSAKTLEPTLVGDADMRTHSDTIATQRHNGMTIHIRWTYLDATRFGVEYDIQGVEALQGTRTLCPVTSVVYTEQNKKPVTQKTADLYCVQTTSDSFFVSQSFERRPSVATSVTSLLRIAVKPNAVSDVSTDNTFDFHLTLLESSGQSLTGPIVQSHNGVPITLMYASINPSLTVADLCIDLPTNADWLPESVLSVGDNTVYGNWRLLNADNPKTFESTHRCYRYQYPLTIGSDSTDSTVVLTVPKLQTSIPEQIDAPALNTARYQLQDIGIAIDVILLESGYSFSVVQKPIDMTEEKAHAYVIDALTSTVKGPWSFTIVP